MQMKQYQSLGISLITKKENWEAIRMKAKYCSKSITLVSIVSIVALSIYLTNLVEDYRA